MTKDSSKSPTLPQASSTASSKTSNRTYASDWKKNHTNQSLSGIEIINSKGKLVNFIMIKNDEVLISKQPHRIVITLNDTNQPILPEPQTFEQIIQARRKQQNALWAQQYQASRSSRNHSNTNHTTNTTTNINTINNSNTGTVSNRTATKSKTRSGRAPTRANFHSVHQTPTNNNNNNNNNINNVPPTVSAPIHSNSLHDEDDNTDTETTVDTTTNTTITTPTTTPKITKKSKPKASPKSSASPSKQQQQAPQSSKSPPKSSPSSATTSKVVAQTNAQASTAESTKSKPPIEVVETYWGTVPPGSTVYTSGKELKEPGLDIDRKQLKHILKTALPGQVLVLSDGSVIRKSRRGGARAGAGRKRSRPQEPSETTVKMETEPIPDTSMS